MGEPDKRKDPVEFFSGERVAHGLATPDQPARQESLAQVKGGSIKIAYMDVAVRRPDGRATQGAVAESSQIFRGFVQIQAVYFENHQFCE